MNTLAATSRVSLEPHDAVAYVFIGVDLHPATARDALRSLETVSARFRTLNDARAVFPDIYAVVIRDVIDAVEGRRGPELLDPQRTSRLAGRLCERYLAALSNSLGGRDDLPGVWAVAFDASRSRSRLTIPVQDALLGVHAHLAVDLAQCLAEDLAGADVETVELRRHDFFALSSLLREALSDAIVHLTARYDCGATRSLTANLLLRRMASDAAVNLLHQWRSQVWEDAIALRALPGEGRRGVYAAALDRAATRTACWLAAPRTVEGARWIIDTLIGISARLPLAAARPLAA